MCGYRRKRLCGFSLPGGQKAGVKMGMPLFMARREFPDVIYLNGCHDLYRRFSAQVMNHLRALVAEVEVVSIDEAYADLTSLDAVYHTDYFSLARQIREKNFPSGRHPGFNWNCPVQKAGQTCQ